MHCINYRDETQHNLQTFYWRMIDRPIKTASTQSTCGTLAWLTAFTALTALIAAYFWPLLRVYPDPRISSTHPDALEFIWSTWRLDRVLNGTEKLYFSQNVFAPQGASLLLHTICEGVLLPVTYLLRFIDPVWRYNLSLVIALTLNAAAGLSLFRSLGIAPLGSAVASALIVFSPSSLGHLHAGHLNFVALFGLIEAIHGALIFSGLAPIANAPRSPIPTDHRQIPTPAKHLSLKSLAAIRYGFSALILSFTNLYYLYFAALLISITAVFAAYSAYRKEHGNSVLVRMIFAAVHVCTPFTLGLLMALPHLIDVTLLALSGAYSPDHRAADHSADLVTLFTPSPVLGIGQTQIALTLRGSIPLHIGESSLYLGAALIVATLVACFSGERKGRRLSRFFAAVAAIFAILSCGPTVLWRGSPIFTNPADFVLRAILPMYPSVPARFAAISSIALVISASSILRLRSSTFIQCCSAALFTLACLEYAPALLGTYPLPLPSPVVQHLAKDQEAKIVADLSTSPQYAMLRQTIHGKPITGGFLSRHPRKAAAALRRNRFVRLLKGNPEPDSALVIQDWCALGANRLIMELPVAQIYNSRLSELGFTEVLRDHYVALWVTDEKICAIDS